MMEWQMAVLNYQRQDGCNYYTGQQSECLEHQVSVAIIVLQGVLINGEQIRVLLNFHNQKNERPREQKPV